MYQRFSRLTTREKFLLNLFVWTCLIMWGFYLWGQYRALNAEFNSLQQASELNQTWFDAEEDIQGRLSKALKFMDPKKTYSKNAFLGKVDAVARKTGLRYDVSNPQTRPNDVFQEHSTTLQLRKATLANLIELDKALGAESPYVGLQSIKMVPDRGDPNNLNAQLDLVALELSDIPNLKNLLQ